MNDQKTATHPSKKEEAGEIEHTPESVSFFLLFLYITFCTSFLCALVPISSASVFAFMICICILAAIYTYRVRGKKSKNKLVIAHTSYIISTFWRANILLAITSFIGLLYMLVMVDYGPFDICTKPIISAINNGHVRALQRILNVCGELVVEKNRLNLKIAGFIAFFPVFLYVLWRCVRGSMLLAFSKTQLSGRNALIKKIKYKG
jgi:uncharacterized membrane protein